MAEWTRHRSTALRRRIEKALGPTGDAGDIVDAHTARDMLDEIDRLGALINNPHTDDFLESVRIEAAHQRERWPEDHDRLKAPADWFWLIGYLAGKAIRPAEPDKLLHRIIATAAACLNWHRQVSDDG